MTHVANLENCKKLYELSGWEDTHLNHLFAENEVWQLDHGTFEYYKKNGYDYAPAYDAGYLLRKLPAQTLLLKYNDVYKATMPFNGDATADLPENALCLLAIELFKIGVLK